MIANRVKNLKASPTLALAAQAKELAAAGRDVISLSLGEPDWDPYEVIKEAGVKSIHSGKVKYSPATGIPELRNQISKVTSEELGLSVRPENVAVSPGGKFAIYSLMEALINPGEEVLMSRPFWVSYPAMVELVDGVSVFVDCRKNPGMKLLAADLEKCLTPKSKMVILNSPSNPTGAVHTREELLDIAKVLRKNPNLILLSDDIYNRLVFDGEIAPHILHVAPDLIDRVVIINGVSKTFSMTGWRLGWIVAPTAIIQATSNYMSQAMSCSSYISQDGAIAALTLGIPMVKKTVENLKKRCELACAALAKIPQIQFEKPAGAFYLWIDVNQTLGKTLTLKNGETKKINDSREWCQALLSEEAVSLVPGLEFGVEGYVRSSFVLKEERMGEAFRRLAQFLNSFK